MRYSFLLFFIFITASAFSQDILILRKGEVEVKCHIVSVNDSLVVYRKWDTPGTAVFSFKRHEVLSYSLENRSGKSKEVDTSLNDDSGTASSNKKQKKNRKDKSKTDPDEGILGLYHSGETVDGYVILNSGDTVNGQIAIQNVALNQVVVSIKNTNGIKKEYSPTELIGYSYKNINYSKVKTKYSKEVINGRGAVNGFLLLHCEVDGRAKLYRMYKLKFAKSVYYYNQNPPSYLGKLKRYFVIENGNGKVIITKGGALRNTLLKLFNDDAILTAQLLEKSPKIADLKNIIIQHNSRK